MDNTTQIDKEPLVQKYALYIALAVFALSLIGYLVNFHGPVSDEQDKWGQFGDFLGGAINPMVGLITIWLLTASLKQSREEMRLTRKALQDAETSQKATETALREQIEVAQQARDMNNTIALWGKLDASSLNLQSRITNDQKVFGPNAEYIILMQEQLKFTEKNLRDLGAIMQIETNRLFAKYLPEDPSDDNT